MFRKIMIALVAIVTIGAASATGAQARGRARRLGPWLVGAVADGAEAGVRLSELAYGLGLAAGYPYYGGGYGYGGYPYGAYAGGCWRSVRVGTPYGWRWRRVWVC